MKEGGFKMIKYVFVRVPIKDILTNTYLLMQHVGASIPLDLQLLVFHQQRV